jgi:hypothetical protein
MATTPIPEPQPVLPRPGQKVRWRDPLHARAWGWEDVFGPGPFEVVRIVDQCDHGLGVDFVLQTELGEREIPEVWLALAEELQEDTGDRPGRLTP